MLPGESAPERVLFSTTSPGLAARVEAAVAHVPVRLGLPCPHASEPAGTSMIARWRDRLAGILPRGVILLSALTFASYVMGLVRDRTFARTFGAGSELDVYNAALVLPELVLDVLVVAGLSSAFVPVFSRLRHEGDSAEVLARTVLTASVLVMLVTVSVLFVLAPQTVTLVAPGFDAAQQAEYTQLFRVMCVTAVIFAASFALGEMLVVRQQFLSYGLAPVLYNTGIVLGAVFQPLDGHPRRRHRHRHRGAHAPGCAGDRGSRRAGLPLPAGAGGAQRLTGDTCDSRFPRPWPSPSSR